jgi:hypothetical protein
VPRTITDAHVEEMVVRTLEEVPEGATHRSKRELAKRVGISPTSVHRIWRAFGLQPWRTEDFKISPDPLLIDKIRDVIGLYLAPPTNAAVFAVDKKPPGSRSPPCAHHDPLCAMQTREWTSTRTIQNGGSARFAQVEGRSHYVSGRGRSPGSRLWMPFDARTCEAHQARISRTCGGGDGLARDPLARRALTYSVAAAARGRHRLIGCRR